MSQQTSHTHAFARRHIGPSPESTSAMLRTVGSDSLEAFARSVVPEAIRTSTPLNVGEAMDERTLLQHLRSIASENIPHRSLIGMGYHDTILPTVVLRNILENPGWYTAYTPYQAEIAQGRLEALLNYQTMVIDLTAMEIANASLLDEGTAAAEAMNMFAALKGHPAGGSFLVSSPDDCGTPDARTCPRHQRGSG
jgi:glycine dehydrogenase